jgi:type II secretory pathway component PulF
MGTESGLFDSLMTFQEKADTFFALSRMLEAGLPVSKAMEVLLNQKSATAVAAWLLGVHREIGERKTLSEAIATQGGASDIEKSLIHAGERSGKLPQMTAEVADYYRLMADSQKRALKVLLYPAVLIQLIFVLPEVRRLFGDELPLLVVSHIVLKIIGISLLMWGAFKVVLNMMSGANKSPAMERFFNRIPFYGDAHKQLARVRFAKVVEAGLLAALGMPEIFRLAGLASQNAQIRNASELIATSTAQGESLTDAFAKTDAFPLFFRDSIAVAEASGTLDKAMKRLARTEREAFIEALARDSKRLPVILYGGLVCYALIKALSFYLYQNFM